MRIRPAAAKRLAALLLCALLAAAVLFSAWLMISHAHHDCTGEQCLVCAGLHAAQNLLRQMRSGGAGPLSLPPLLLFLVGMVWGFGVLSGAATPIALKVRMNR